MKRIEPDPGQESVWDYPRPPRLERVERSFEIIAGGRKLVETDFAFRVLETSHPPVYYFRPDDIDQELIRENPKHSFCEWKGNASYVDIIVETDVIREAGWYYPQPTPTFAEIKNCVAFYPGRVDDCRIDGERVTPQPGEFYGGWITSDVVGPFKGEPGTWGW